MKVTFDDREIAFLKKLTSYPEPPLDEYVEGYEDFIDELDDSDSADYSPVNETSSEDNSTALEHIFMHIESEYEGLKSSQARNVLWEALLGTVSSDWGATRQHLIEKLYFKLLLSFDHIAPTNFDKIIQMIVTVKADREIFVQYFRQIPFGIVNQVESNIDKIRSVLDSLAYGMAEAKQCIIENLVLFMHSHGEGAPSPLLLVGPPGTGKTALAHAVGKALNLPFAKFSLASAHDPMMLRGSSPGWRNSAPGLVLKELINAKCLNPVWLWDEIDKAGGSSAGDIIDVLTELFDPQMAREYRDTFVEMPIDLSKVFSIATANDIEAIPVYIRDRCNIVTIRPYSTEEKVVIILDYLPSQLQQEMRLSYSIVISNKIAERLSRSYSLRTAKRLLRRLIAQKLMTMRPGEIQALEINSMDEQLYQKNERRHIGFCR